MLVVMWYMLREVTTAHSKTASRLDDLVRHLHEREVKRLEAELADATKEEP